MSLFDVFVDLMDHDKAGDGVRRLGKANGTIPETLSKRSISIMVFYGVFKDMEIPVSSVSINIFRCFKSINVFCKRTVDERKTFIYTFIYLHYL